MKYSSFVLRCFLVFCIAGIELTAHAGWRTEYTPPHQSPDVNISVPVVGANAALVSVALAHELNGPSGRYCSPEVDIFNASSNFLKDIILNIDYFQKASIDNSVFVGSTTTHAHNLAPGSFKRETFYVLETANCNALSGVVRIQLCETGDGSDCTASIGLTQAGRVPLRHGPPGVSDRIMFAVPRHAVSPSVPVPATR